MKTALKYLLPVVLLAASFAGGIFYGRVQCFNRRFDFRHREAFRERILDRMERGLSLSKEQREQVKTVLSNQREQFELLRKEIHPRFESIHNDTREKIRELLTPEQQKLFDEKQMRIMPDPPGHRRRPKGPSPQ